MRFSVGVLLFVAALLQASHAAIQTDRYSPKRVKAVNVSVPPCTLDSSGGVAGQTIKV